MTTYFLSLLTAMLVSALVGILAPGGENSGVKKHLRLLTALFLVCVLTAPLTEVIQRIRQWSEGELSLPGLEDVPSADYGEQMNDAMSSASKTYVTQMLTQTLESEFAVTSGEMECVILWDEDADGGITPRRVTVVLSGRAIWKDPAPIRQFVTALLECECVVAIR